MEHNTEVPHPLSTEAFASLNMVKPQSVRARVTRSGSYETERIHLTAAQVDEMREALNDKSISIKRGGK